MDKICTGTEYDRDHCGEEKRGCIGCDHYKTKGGNCDGKKASECPNNKSDKTN